MRETKRGQEIIITWTTDSFQWISSISPASIRKLCVLEERLEIPEFGIQRFRI